MAPDLVSRAEGRSPRWVAFHYEYMMLHTECGGKYHADHTLHATLLSNSDGMCLF